MSIFLIFLQLLILGKNFPKQYWLQIPVSFLFSYFIDLTMGLLQSVCPIQYWVKMLFLLLGCVVLGVGVSLEFVANVVMLPGEAFVNAIVKRFRTDMGRTKVAFDSSMTVIAGLIGMILYHKLAGVREGTIIAAILVGLIAREIKKRIESFLQKRRFASLI